MEFACYLYEICFWGKEELQKISKTTAKKKQWNLLLTTEYGHNKSQLNIYKSADFLHCEFCQPQV